jgi:hypothetical protein
MTTKAIETYAGMLYRNATANARFEAGHAEAETDPDVAAIMPHLSAEVERAGAATAAYEQAIRDMLPDAEARKVVKQARAMAKEMQDGSSASHRDDVIGMARRQRAAAAAEANDY